MIDEVHGGRWPLFYPQFADRRDCGKWRNRISESEYLLASIVEAVRRTYFGRMARLVAFLHLEVLVKLTSFATTASKCRNRRTRRCGADLRQPVTGLPLTGIEGHSSCRGLLSLGVEPTVPAPRWSVGCAVLLGDRCSVMCVCVCSSFLSTNLVLSCGPFFRQALAESASRRLCSPRACRHDSVTRGVYCGPSFTQQVAANH